MKPILLSTEMVQAILDGRKTVMRRVIKLPAGYDLIGASAELSENIKLFGKEDLYHNDETTNKSIKPPYQIGDVLWVRETWNADWCDHVIYKADGGSAKEAGYSKEPKWRPSIHMPREAARIFLKVTDVRVEQLQDIMKDPPGPNNQIVKEGQKYGCDFIATWNNNAIKKKVFDEFGWDANPWVFVYEFERITEDEAKKTEQRMILKISKKF